MANHFRLYGRPLMADEVEASLSVTGELEGYTAGDAYESRLQINNSIGKCTVRVIESTLPPGAFVRVDNITKEVVVKWAAYTEVVAEETMVPNGDFEDGDDGTWNLVGPGWSIGSGPDYSADSGSFSARFADVKTKGSDILLPFIPAKVNDYIKVNARVKQGASSSGNAGARVWLTYHDANLQQIGDHPGNLITSGKDGNWGTSSAEGGAPADTAYVLVRIAAYRNKQNKALWVDNVTWNHKYVLGQDNDEVYSLSIEVTDGLNRKAYWSGDIEEYLSPLTSLLYPVEISDGIGINGAVSNLKQYTAQKQAPDEQLSIGGSVSGFTLHTVASLTPTLIERASISGSVSQFRFTTYGAINVNPAERASLSGSVTGLLLKTHKNANPSNELVTISGSITGFRIG
jgi:hypothetical protein